ncbi:hypothetical protein CDO73_09200 [Saccharibacillus sp. O23]|uniref:DUF2262 domain-containing protein n=1 Tax=Saccharibacillus sp. O23 TaxID=2009338 RepID=UPI000B4E7A63|nr:DUF2262 domain-containing protein [Saccharibacillus sp. O23]OWR30757.1 hypothetical protein CDO73_09200 [Saccharibacillus sp. O23]
MDRTTHYRNDAVGEWLKQAYAGDEKARRRLANLEGPHALAPDYSALVHVQLKDAARKPDGAIRILNKAPEPNSGDYPCADLYRIWSEGASWTHIPVPPSFDLANVVFASAGEDGRSARFAFESADGRRTEASLAQMGIAFRDLDLVMRGAKEAEIEEAFRGMETSVVPLPPVRRTEADNPPIELDGYGFLAFDESVQGFEGTFRAGESEIRAALDTAVREEAVRRLPRLAELLERLAETDAAARRCAAEELTELKNDFWLDDGEEEITEEAFVARMDLESITLGEDGGATFWYADGDLFGGHTICVEQGGDGKFISAEMMG